MGSMDYFYEKLQRYAETLPDEKITELCNDLSVVFRDRELMIDEKIANAEYKKTQDWFKEKWL